MIDQTVIGEQIGAAVVYGVVAGFIARLLKLISGRG